VKGRQQTSENVKEVVLCFLRLAVFIAETDALVVVANGTKINEMKKEGTLAELEKLSTLYIRGSARSANIAMPSTKSIIALHQDRKELSTTASLFSLSTNLSVASQVFYITFPSSYPISCRIKLNPQF
jgi:hypothetical protein